MAITLQEAKVGMADKVDQQIIDTFQRSSMLLDALTFDNCISPGTGGSTLAYGYIQLQTPSTAAVRAINTEYTPGEAKRVKKTTQAIVMGGSFEVDRVLQNTSGAVDELAFQAEQKIKATANMFHNLVINGTASSSGAGYVPNTFDGLAKLLSGTSNEFTSGVDISTSAAMDSNKNALLDELKKDPYYSQPLPKTTGRELFGVQYTAGILDWWRAHPIPQEDLVATVTDLTAYSIADAYERYVLPRHRASELIVGGGGSYNAALLAFLAKRFAPYGIAVRTQEDLGLNSDAKEAVAFAMMADCCIRGRANTLPGVTGARHPVVMGKISQPYKG